MFWFIFTAMKPFLLLQHRYLDEASHNEYDAVIKYSGLSRNFIKRIRLEKNPIGTINLDEYSGIILGGGPANVSNKPFEKRPEQLRFEKELEDLYSLVFSTDFPFLGMCYGMGSITKYLKGNVSKETFSEPVGAVTIFLNEDEKDPILMGIPTQFRALVGHKESCISPPDDCVILASSKECPFHMIRAKQNIYATQFHPELDVEGIILRIGAYKNYGYFNPEEAEALIRSLKHEKIIYPQIILKNFINRYSS